MRLIAKKDAQGRVIGFEAVDENGIVQGGAVTPAARDAGNTPAIPGAPLPTYRGDFRSPSEKRAAAGGGGRGSSGSGEDDGGYYVPPELLGGAGAQNRMAQADTSEPRPRSSERPVEDAMGPALTQNSMYNENAATDERLAAERERGGFRGAVAGFRQFGRNVARGVVDGVEDITDFGAAVIDTVRGQEVNDDDNFFNPSARTTDASSSGGKFLQEAVSFGTSGAILGVVGRAVGIARIPAVARLARGGWAGKAAVSGAGGAVTDFVKAKQGEENLYNAVKGTPLDSPVARFFAADTDEDSNLWLNKTKEALGGIPLGIAFDLFGDAVGKAARKLNSEPLEQQMRGIKAAKGLPEEAQEATLRELDGQVTQTIQKNQLALAAAIEGETGVRITDARRLLKAADEKSAAAEGFIDIEITEAPILAGGTVDMDWDTRRLQLLEEELVQLEEYRGVLSGDEGLTAGLEKNLVDELDDAIFELEDEVTAITTRKLEVPVDIAADPEGTGRSLDVSADQTDIEPLRTELEDINRQLAEAPPETDGTAAPINTIRGLEADIEAEKEIIKDYRSQLPTLRKTEDVDTVKGVVADINKRESKVIALRKQLEEVQSLEGDDAFEVVGGAGLDLQRDTVDPTAAINRESLEARRVELEQQIAEAEATVSTPGDDFGGLTYKPKFEGDRLVTVDLDRVYSDWQKNGLPDLVPGRQENISQVLDTLKETGEPLDAPELTFKRGRGFDIRDGRSRITELKARGVKKIQAVVDDLDVTDAEYSNGPAKDTSQFSEADYALPETTPGSAAGGGSPTPVSNVDRAPLQPTPGREANIIGGEGVGRREEVVPTDGPGAQPDREPSLRGGDAPRVDLANRFGQPTKSPYRSKPEIKRDVARKTVEKRVKSANPIPPKADVETPASTLEAPEGIGKEKPVNRKAKRGAKEMGIDVKRLRDNFMGSQSNQDVGRFVNMDKLTDSDDVVDVVQAVIDSIPNNKLQDDLPDAVLQRQASNLTTAVAGLPREEGDALLLAFARNPANLASANLAIRMLTNDMANQVLEVARRLPNVNKVSDMTISQMTEQEDFILKLSRLEHFVTFNKNLGKLTAQGLRARGLKLTDAEVALRLAGGDYEDLFKRSKKMTAGPSEFQTEMQKLLGTPEGRKKFERIQSDIVNAKDMDEVLQMTKAAKFSVFTPLGKAHSLLQGVRMNGILSGTGTNLTNIVSNGTMMIYAPATQMAGALLDMPYQRLRGHKVNLAADKKAFMEAAVQLASLTQYMGDSARMARVALRRGAGVLSGDQMAREIADNSIDMLNPQTGNTLFDWTLQALSVPTRLLVGGDEFFKQMNYRANLRGRAWQFGVDQGMKPGSKKLREFADRMVSDSFAIDESTGLQGLARDKASREYAEFVTFQQEINSDTSRLRLGLVEIVDKLRNSPIAPIRALTPLFVPFIKTPANVMAYTARNSPLAMVSKGWQDDIAAGGARAARAKGEFALGTTAMMGIIGLGMQGRLTGRAPADPGQRELFYKSGMQPYSVNIGGNKWVSFQRMEPFAGHFGIIADLVQAASLASKDDEIAITEGIMQVTGAFVSAVKNRTFFEGLSELTEVIDAFGSTDGRDKAKIKTATENIAASFVPYSSFLNEQRRARDLTLREAEGIVEKIMNRLPGYSESLPAQRDWLTGQPIMYSANPILNLYPSVAQKDDALIKKLLKYNVPINPPDESIKAGVELTKAQYSQLLALTGQIQLPKYGGKTQYEALAEVFEKFDTTTLDAELDYIQANDEYARLTPLSVAVGDVRKDYALAAESALVQANPELIEQVRTKLNESGNVKEGIFWMNSPLFEDLGYETVDDPVFLERLNEVRKRTNKGLEGLVEGPGPLSTDPLQ